MPMINKIHGHVTSLPAANEVPRLPNRPELRIEDQFQAAGSPGPDLNRDVYFARSIRNQLEQNGIIGVSDGGFRALPLEVMEKVRHLIGKSEDPLMFLVRLSESGEILGINSYAKKSDWLNAIEAGNFGAIPPAIRDLRAVDRITQLNYLTRILGPAATGL